MSCSQSIGDANCDTEGDNLHCQIQEAIDAAETGDEIAVHDGIYDAINKLVQLQ